MALRSFLLPILSLSTLAFACSSSSDDSAAASPGVDPPADTTPAPAPAPPPAAPPPPAKPAYVPSFPTVSSRGGPVIASPRVVPIVFKGDTMESDIDTFTKKLAASSYWTGVATEYGVGALTASDPIVLDETPDMNLTSEQIESWLVMKLTGATPELGAPDPNALYAVFYPSSTKITMDLGGGGAPSQSCQAFGGYHSEITAGATKVGYAVLPRCSGLDDLTVATSHEIFEWATDPFPMSNAAFDRLDDAHWAFQATFIGELGDMCTFLDPGGYIKPAEIGYSVQRMWSNKASKAGSFPCAPTSGGSYIQAIPEAADDTLVPDFFDLSGLKQVTTKAIRVAPGKSKSVDVLVYSDKPSTTQVALRAMTWAEVYGMPDSSGFTFDLDKSRAAIGSTVSVTVTAPKDASYDLLVMLAYLDDKHVEYWPVLVTNDDGAGLQASVRTHPGRTSFPRRIATRAGLPR
ncbi:MAG TPA: hypothetical protein VIF62_37460 [Labilithrix sp.]|jgi:hypothetical protein